MYIHTSLQYKLIQLQSNISTKLGVLPFIWDPNSKKYKNDAKSFRFSLCTTVCLFTIQYLFALWNILYHVLLYKSLPITGQLFYSSIWLIIFALQQLQLFALYYKCDDFITLLNTLKFHSHYIAGNIYFTKRIPTNKIHAKF